MTRILLVEDDETLGETLQERLQREGYQVEWVSTQADAEKSYAERRYDLIILDVGLPDGSGFDFARQVQALGQNSSLLPLGGLSDGLPGSISGGHVAGSAVRSTKPTPFLFVTAMNTAEYRLEGYEIGAEEFIPKPFHLKELLLRVRHVLSTHGSNQSDEVVAGDRVIDLMSRAVVAPDGAREFLATRDFDLLKLLIGTSPKVLSRDQILDEVWGEDKFPSHRTVDNAIVRLRQALGEKGGRWIRSVRGVGYQWIPNDGATNEDDDHS